MAALVGIVSGHDFSIHTHRQKLATEGKLVLYKPLFHCSNHLKQLYLLTRWSASVLKVGVADIDVCVSSHLKEELAWATEKRFRVISTTMLFKNSYSTKKLKGTIE